MEEMQKRFLEAMELVTLAELERNTERSWSAWQKYGLGQRRITRAAAEELAAYLRSRARAFDGAADALEEALRSKEESDG